MANSKLKTKFKNLKTTMTPDGIASWAYLDEPDEAFGKILQRITVFFDKDDDNFKTFLKLVMELRNKFFADNGMKPKGKLPKSVKVADKTLAEKAKVPVGSPYIQFETKPELGDDGQYLPVPVFNAAGERIRRVNAVWGGDIVSIETNITGWENSTGMDVKFFLGSVQLLKSNRGRAERGTSIGAREDYITNDGEDDVTVEGTPDVAGLIDEDLDLDLSPAADPAEGLV